MRTALAKQIPALVKGLLKITQPAGGVRDLGSVLLHAAAQFMFSIDHLANALENVGVIHGAQPRERAPSTPAGVPVTALRCGEDEEQRDRRFEVARSCSSWFPRQRQTLRL